MGFYIDRENYFRSLAIDHADVLHDQPVSDEDETPRRSFFRINDEEELLAASQHWIHFPCVVMVGLSGGQQDRGGSVRQANVNTLMFLHKLKPDAENPIEATAISDTYDATFEVMQDFIARIVQEHNDDDGCGMFKNLDEGSFKWDQVGPIGDSLHGWSLTFRDETKRKSYNADNWGGLAKSKLLSSDEDELLVDADDEEDISLLTD